MDKMKRLIIILFSFLLSACSHDMNRREIDEINFIHVMGIDFSEGEYVLTAIYSSSQGADPEKGSVGDEETSEGRGRTPFEAFQDLKLKNKKSVSIANTGYFLIGERAAQNGIGICVDFLSRDETVKMESLVFVTRDVEAAYFISQSIEKGQTVHEDLEAVEQKQQELVTRNDNTLVNILNDLENNITSGIVPYLIAEENSFLLQGYAVFDKLVLVDYLDMDTSSGINFIKNIIRAYPIYLKNNVGLSISYSKSRIKSKLDNNKVKIIIRLNFETMVKENNSKENIFSAKSLNSLTDMQNDYIRKIMQKATNYSIHTGRDILQIARLVQNQHSKKWSDLVDDWSSMISDIEYEFDIKSQITKSFILSTGK
ncbi:MAG: Ger(x)C family spore germination protein [Anaerolineaceae bacterium]|nr:MAG: Ger(x)C family spore germination protein [Anaerolineaceae bacterium]